MTLSRPPTMRVTFGAAELLPPEDDGLSDPPQAVRPAASAATAAVAVRMRTVFMGWSSFVVERGGAARRGGGRPARDGGGPAGPSSDACAGGGRVRPPGQEAVLDAGEDQLGQQGQHGGDDHGGVDAGRVERAL